MKQTRKHEYDISKIGSKLQTMTWVYSVLSTLISSQNTPQTIDLGAASVINDTGANFFSTNFHVT